MQLSVSPNSRVLGIQGLVSRTVFASVCKTHTSVFLLLGHARETVSRHVSCRAPFRHVWAGTYGQRLHPQGRCALRHQRRWELCSHTTATVPSWCSTAAWHHHAALSRHSLLHRLAGCSSTPSRLSSCPGPGASRRCGSPFFLEYVLHATSFPSFSLTAGWVFPRGDTGSLQGTHFVPGPRFIVYFLNLGCLVDSRRR